MKNEKDISILDELSSRLDDFFSEDDILEDKDIDDRNDVENDIPNKVVVEEEKIINFKEDRPFDNLKAILLEMDWEINDDNLKRYLNELEILINKFCNDRVVYLFLKLLKSLGIYMICKKSNANPDVLKFLYNSFNCIEKIFNQNLDLYNKNLLIIKETEKFKRLKETMFPKKYKENEQENNVKKKNLINFKELPVEIQKEINDYIENEIKAKINELKKRMKSKIK